MKLNIFGIVLLLTVCGSSIAKTIIPGFSDEISNRIISGEQAYLGQFPWQAQLESTITGRRFCGGMVISPEWILTAAHCLQDKTEKSFKVNVGLKSFGDKETITVNVDKIIRHENFITSNLFRVMQNDIALMHLTSAMKYNKNVKPISLSNNSLALNSEVIVSGWGITDPKYLYDIDADEDRKHLNYVDLKTVSGQTCVDAVKHAKLVPVTFPKGTICTYGAIPEGKLLRKSACKGDSGGPLITGSGENAVLVGIVSWGDPECQKGTAFADVAYYRDWIKKMSGV